MKAGSFVRYFLLASFVLAPLAHAEEMKIGFVHLERAINEVDEGIQAKADLKKLFEKKQAMLQKTEGEAKAAFDEFEKQAAVLKEDAKKKKLLEAQKKAAEAQQLAAKLQQEMMEEQNKAMGSLMQKMNSLVSKMATDGNYTYILNKSEASILWGKPALDLTNELIRNYNSTHGKSSSKAKT